MSSTKLLKSLPNVSSIVNLYRSNIMFYNLRITKEELDALIEDGQIIIENEINTNCDTCSEDIDIEIQIILEKD